MRIESIGNKPLYQTPQAKTQSTGTESEVVEKPKHQNTITKNTEINNKEAQVSSELKQDQNEYDVIKAIEKANSHFRTFDRRLEFTIHNSTKQIIVKVINTEDDSVIREIPSEKVLDMVAHMWEVAGILVDKKI